jgi:hypothetical protein
MMRRRRLRHCVDHREEAALDRTDHDKPLLTVILTSVLVLDEITVEHPGGKTEIDPAIAKRSLALIVVVLVVDIRCVQRPDVGSQADWGG